MTSEIILQDTQATVAISMSVGASINRTLATVNTGDLVVVTGINSCSGGSLGRIGTLTSPNLTFTKQFESLHPANGQAAIFTAVYTGPGLTNEVITMTNVGGVSHESMCVTRWSGADTSALTTGGTNFNAVNSLVWTVSATATGPASYLVGVVFGGPNTNTASPDAGTTMLATFSTGYSHAHFRSTSRGGSGVRTCSGTWPSVNAFDAAVIEIKGL
jgi:hypothetical protein